jgi:K+-sensing histidine kinase KdpD
METNFVEYPFKTMWRGLATHLLTLAFLAGGVFFGITGIMNLLVFTSFIYVFLMIVLLFTSSDGLKPNIPIAVSAVFYGIMIFVLVYNGYFFTGAAWLISGLILGHLTDEYKTKLKEAEEQKQNNNAKNPATSGVISTGGFPPGAGASMGTTPKSVV